MIPIFDQIDLTDPDCVVGVLGRAAEACRSAACRRGSIDLVRGPGKLIATGDLHDNPLHLARLVAAAGIGDAAIPAAAHITFHEIIHPDRLVNGMDFSYRALTRVAALKVAHPEHVHLLLANHELAQVLGSGIVKDGVRVVEAFNEGVEYAFGDRAGEVLEAVKGLVRAMPLALLGLPSGVAWGGEQVGRWGGEGGSEFPVTSAPPHLPTSSSILFAHSLPPPELMERFDPGVLERDLSEEDYVPRQGSAHLMVWGRGHTAEQLRGLAERWGVGLFVLGHEKAEEGAMVIAGGAGVVLNSDHDRGVYVPIEIGERVTAEEVVGRAVRLGG